MRTDISVNRFGWLYRLDYKKLIVVVFLLRLILASAYDIFVTITDNDVILPDSKFYSMKGRYIDLLLQGHNSGSFTRDLLPNDKISLQIFVDVIDIEKSELPTRFHEANIYCYIVGLIYFIFGYSTIWVRVFNICISILSVYLLFKVVKRHFGDLTANLFLLIALLLPTQSVYSITFSRDFLRLLFFSAIIWAAYNMEDLWIKRLRP